MDAAERSDEMSREARLVPLFNGGAYGPGDTVDGVLVLREPMERLRTLTGYLRYTDRSPHYAGGAMQSPAVQLHSGPAEVGQEIPFELRMPDDAYPNWQEPSTSSFGSLSWSLVLEADIAADLDTTTTHALPVDTNGRAWTGPAPLGEERVKRQVKSFDVEVIPDRWSLRRGEEVTVRVHIGKPKAERPMLEIGVLCQAFYDVEETVRTSDDTDYRRNTKYVYMFEEWFPFDPSLPEQSFTTRVPEDAPFSYHGSAFGFKWMAIAREKRRWYQSDAGHVATLEILP
jgi:hypothetical protein